MLFVSRKVNKKRRRAQKRAAFFVHEICERKSRQSFLLLVMYGLASLTLEGNGNTQSPEFGNRV